VSIYCGFQTVFTDTIFFALAKVLFSAENVVEAMNCYSAEFAAVVLV
jgi:hypothetical protein